MSVSGARADRLPDTALARHQAPHRRVATTGGRPVLRLIGRQGPPHDRRHRRQGARDRAGARTRDRTDARERARRRRRATAATAGKPHPWRADPYTIAGASVALLALLIAGFVGYLYVVSDIQQARDQSILADRLSDELNRDVGPLGGNIDKGSPVAMLRIPAIGVRQVVVEGTTADSLAKGPGHLRTSGLPARAAQRDHGPLAHLRRPVPRPRRAARRPTHRSHHPTGRVHLQGDRAPARRQRRDDVLAPGRENRLVLLTADSWIRPGGRTVVIAELQGAPKAQEGRRPQGLRADEKGTGGYADAGVRLLLWAQAFTLVLVVLVWALRRHPDRRVTLLLGTPVVLAVVWALYESAARVLPATLRRRFSSRPTPHPGGSARDQPGQRCDDSRSRSRDPALTGSIRRRAWLDAHRGSRQRLVRHPQGARERVDLVMAANSVTALIGRPAAASPRSCASSTACTNSCPARNSPAGSCSTARTSTTPPAARSRPGDGWEWSSKSPTRSRRCPSTTTWSPA